MVQAGTATRSAVTRSASGRSGVSRTPTLVRTGSPGCSAQTRKSNGGTPSSVRSTPKTSQTTPNSNGAMPSMASAATDVNTPPAYMADFVQQRLSSHCWQDLRQRTLNAMTTNFTQKLKNALRRGPSMPHPRLYGSSDIEDRDLARVLSDLRVTQTRRAVREP